MYGKVKQFFQWVWNKVVTFWNWLKEKFSSFIGKAKNEEKDLTEIDVSKLLEEGEESLATNYKEVNSDDTKIDIKAAA